MNATSMTARRIGPRATQERLKEPVARVIAARVVAEVMRENVNVVETKALAEGDYRTDKGEKITEPKNCYMVKKGQWDALFADLKNRKDEAGLKGSKPEYCPACEAEHSLLKAERELIDFAGTLFEGMNADRCCGVLGAWKKAVDLLCGLALAEK